MLSKIPLRIEEEKHRRLKLRAFDYKMSMNDYIKQLLEMSFKFSDQEFYELINSEVNGFDSLLKESVVKKVLVEKLSEIQINEHEIEQIIDALKSENQKKDEV